MMSGTKQEVTGCSLVSVPEFTVGLGKRDDLFFTDSRMVVVGLGRNQAVGQMAGGLIGRAIAKRSESKDRENRALLSLDEMI
jgi:hypothetical protein